MANDSNGQPIAEPAVLDMPQAIPQDQLPPEPADLSSLNDFIAQPPEPPPGNQGGQVTMNQVDWEKQYKEVQSWASKVQAENLRLKQQQPQQQPQQPSQQQQHAQQPQNPFDPNAQPNEWWDWKIQQGARVAAYEANQGLLHELQRLAVQSNEDQWFNQHPNVNREELIGFAHARGIRNIDDAYMLLQLPSMLNQARTGAINQTVNQFNKTQTATPAFISGNPQPGEVALNFDQMMVAFAKNPNVIDSWHPTVQKMFRDKLRSVGRQ